MYCESLLGKPHTIRIVIDISHKDTNLKGCGLVQHGHRCKKIPLSIDYD